MLKKLRIRMISTSMLAFFAVISLVGILVNSINYYMVTHQADQTIELILSLEKGDAALEPPEFQNPPGLGGSLGIPGAPEMQDTDRDSFPQMFFRNLPDPEANYRTRFFIIRCDEAGEILSTYTDYISSVEEADLRFYVQKALSTRASRGYFQDYRYRRETIEDTTVLVFLNNFNEQKNMRSLLFLTLGVAGASLLLVFILICLFSGKAIRPMVNNIQMQKRFITDASHELKTPLTSISTSMDIIELEYGSDEWVENIRRQTSRMSSLVAQLVTLSRLDEGSSHTLKEHFSISDASKEIADIYLPQAHAHEKNYTVDITPGLSYHGEKASIQQMLSVLLDNAIKYSDEKGDIRFRVYQAKGKINLEIFNTCHYDVPPDTEKIFDRFYRPDTSRSTSTGGTGIGLAIAKAVAEQHNGKITASCPSGNTMTIKVVL